VLFRTTAGRPLRSPTAARIVWHPLSPAVWRGDELTQCVHTMDLALTSTASCGCPGRTGGLLARRCVNIRSLTANKKPFS